MGLDCPVQQGVLGALVVLGGIWVAGRTGGFILLWGISVTSRGTDVTEGGLVLSRSYRGTGVTGGYYWGNWCYGGDAKGDGGGVHGPACAMCILEGGGWLHLGAPQRTQPLWVSHMALADAPGPGEDPHTPPHLSAAPPPRRSISPPSPDEVCGDRRSGPWKNTMEGPHKGGFIQICLEFSGFA